MTEFVFIVSSFFLFEIELKKKEEGDCDVGIEIIRCHIQYKTDICISVCGLCGAFDPR